MELKWNTKHSERIKQLKEPVANPRLVRLSPYLKGGIALDLACGLGGNSLFLAHKNYQVLALDISDVAIGYLKEQAAKNTLPIDAKITDLTKLDQFSWDNQSFDTIVVTYYLDRTLFPHIKKNLKVGGYVFIETYYLSPKNGSQGVSDQYKLKPKELLGEFADWRILYFEENEDVGRQTLFCQKQ